MDLLCLLCFGILSFYLSFRFIKYSAAVAYPHRYLLCCVFRDAFPHTTVVMCGYLRYCHLPVSSEQSGPYPLTSLINKVFLPAEQLLTRCFLFFAPFPVNSKNCCENPRIPTIS